MLDDVFNSSIFTLVVAVAAAAMIIRHADVADAPAPTVALAAAAAPAASTPAPLVVQLPTVVVTGRRRPADGATMVALP